MQLPHERQAGCGALHGLLGEHQDERIVGLFRAPIERLVILYDLPWPDILADEQDKRGRLRNFVGQLLLPEAAGTHALGRKENVRVRVPTLQRGLQRLHQRKVLRSITQEPAPHAGTFISACDFVDQIRKQVLAEYSPTLILRSSNSERVMSLEGHSRLIDMLATPLRCLLCSKSAQCHVETVRKNPSK